MLAAACAPLAPLLDAVISVEEAGVFKPDPRVYALAGARLGLPNAAMAFVSANPWDTQAAMHAGFRAIRVNRSGAPDEYGLAAAGVPSLPDLAALPTALGA
jgi:2-haloacid dehalogenase